jgi:hypothetical protein
VASGDLLVTDAARRVAALFRSPPREAEWRPILWGVSRLAFATLPEPLHEPFEISLGPPARAAMAATFAATRLLRPFLPPRYRYIAPYHEWLERHRGATPPGTAGRARRRAGIRLGG